jgi:SAM-dependent methyltransferase
MVRVAAKGSLVATVEKGDMSRAAPPRAAALDRPDPNPGWLERARAAWDLRAAEWDTRSEANAVARDRSADLARTAAALGLRPGAVLLDAGCGSGQFALAFAALGCRVVGVDLSSEMLARARAHAAERDLDVEWRTGDLSRLPDPDATFDAIHARVSLQFVPDPAAALTEFHRVLRPNGRLYASVPGALSPIYASSWRRFVEPETISSNFLLPWELEFLLAHLGWDIVDGWGSYTATCAGAENPYTADAVATLERGLRQATATAWAVVARPRSAPGEVAADDAAQAVTVQSPHQGNAQCTP